MGYKEGYTKSFAEARRGDPIHASGVEIIPFLTENPAESR